MKKLLSIVLCVTAVSAVSASTEVELGQVGVTAIDNSQANTLVAVSYADLAGGEGIVISNFVKTANLTVGDQLAIYRDGEYTSWILTQGEGGVKFWTKNDRTFKINADGSLNEGTGMLASAVTRAVGSGIRLVRKHPVEAGSPVPLYLYGKPVTIPVLTAEAGKYTLLGNPKQTAAQAKVSGMVDGDTIQVATDGLFPDIYTYKGTQWSHLEQGETVFTETPTVPAGVGFWYVSKGAEPVTIEWIESK